MRVALAGEALIDFAAVGDLLFQGYCGGSPLNTAIAVARLGQTAGYVTQLSDDLFGLRLRRHLEANGVDVRHVLSHPAPTSLAFVEREADTNRYSFLLAGTADSLYAPDPLPTLSDETVFLQFGSISLLREPAATSITRLIELHRDRVTVVFDPNIRATVIDDPAAYRKRLEGWVRLSDIVKLSEEDAVYLSVDGDVARIIEGWLEVGPTAVVLTSGARGARLHRPDVEPIGVSAFHVSVKDTIGAGDTFTAGVIVGLLERRVERREDLASLSADAWRGVLRFAAAAAALDCEREGADPPSRSEVERFIAATESAWPA